MNHRELMLSAAKKARFAFLGLPEDLQDQIIDGLDGQTIGLVEASAAIKSRGFSLSHEGVAAYYRAVRRERRLAELNQEIPRLVEQFKDTPASEMMEAVAKLIMSAAAVGIADGSVGIKDIDMGKVLMALSKQKQTPAGEIPAVKEEGKPVGDNVPDAATIQKIREQFL